MYTYYITEEELRNLTLYHSCSEKNIYKKDNLLLKRYNILDEQTIKKIVYFNSFNLSFTAKPTHLLKIDKKYLGYVMEIKDNYKSLNNCKDLSIYEKYQLLLKLKYYLDELHKYGIIYGDLNPENILTNGNDIYLINIVNSKYDRLNFTSYSNNLIRYMDNNGIMDYNLDNYMFNLLTICFLNDLEYDNVLDPVNNILDNNFNNIEPKEIIGVTDNDICLNIISKMNNPAKRTDKLLIDNMDIKKYNEKVKTLIKKID